MQILAEKMATTFKKGNEGCFICGDKNRLKREMKDSLHVEIKTV